MTAPRRILEEAESAVRFGRYGAAIRLYAEALKSQPSSWEIHHERAKLEFQCGLVDREKASLRRTFRLIKSRMRGRPSVDEWLRMAVVLEHHGRLGDAVFCYRRFARTGGDEERALVRAAALSLRLGRVKAALQLTEGLLARNRGCVPARRVRGAALVLAGRCAEAVPELDFAVSADGGDVESYLWRAEARRRGGDFGAALDDLDRARALRLPITERLGGAINRALIRIEQLGAPSSNELVPIRFMLRQTSAGGARDLKRALARGPKAVAALLERGLARLGGERAAIDFRPDLGPIEEYHRIQKLCLLGDPRAATEEFRRLVRERRSTPRLHGYFGEVYLWWGKRREAVRELKRALALDSSLAWPNIGLAGASLMEGRPERALAFLELAVKNGAAPPRLWVRRGEALYRSGDPRAALKDLRAATAGSHFIASAWILRTLVEGELGDAEAAARGFEKLWSTTPHFIAVAAAEAGFTAGVDMRALGSSERRRILTKALELMRGNRSASNLQTYMTADGEMRAIHIFR